ncbi:hypothetical protein FGO68_gene3378 [Halteria grandinella]|uniref:Uncharacterized protein n=1 Tax=Halteria grandinella TaxID=5974 RepID=A0A8J8P2U0_HALGN|nr:hypothetical protein FGO68_gene3378 [Halteria grandinella]
MGFPRFIFSSAESKSRQRFVDIMFKRYQFRLNFQEFQLVTLPSCAHLQSKLFLRRSSTHNRQTIVPISHPKYQYFLKPT